MSRYVVSDVGMGSICVYQTTVDVKDNQKYYVYKDWKSEDLERVEFLDSIFEPTGNKMVKDARVVANLADDSNIWCRYAEHFGGESAYIFGLDDYVAVEVDYFSWGIEHNGESVYCDSKDIYYVSKSDFYQRNGLATKISERISDIGAIKDKIEEEISGIKRTADRYNQVMDAANGIIDNYFSSDEEISDSSLDTITPEDFARYVEYDNSNVRKRVAKQWKPAIFLEKIEDLNIVTSMLGGAMYNMYACATSEELTLVPLLLGCGYAFVSHCLLDAVRMELAGSKVGKIVENFTEKFDAKTKKLGA